LKDLSDSYRRSKRILVTGSARLDLYGRGARFENMIALHLLRTMHWAEDVEGEKLQVRYFRHREGRDAREVDFVLLRGGRPWLALEAKLSESELAPGLRYFVERVRVPHAFQVVLTGRERRLEDIGSTQVRIVSAQKLLSNLP
jgi:hypothetical protein